MTVLGVTWTRVVRAGNVDCVVTVGEHALYVRRVDGGEPTEAERRAALAEVLGKAVSQIRKLRAIVAPGLAQEPRP